MAEADDRTNATMQEGPSGGTDEPRPEARRPARRGKPRRWIVILALILVPLALVVPPAFIIARRVALGNWIRQHGEVGWDQAPPQWLPESLEFPFADAFGTIVLVELNRGAVDRGWMQPLARLPELRRMRLNGMPIRRASIPPADGFRMLETLELLKLRLSREALTRIGRLPKLRHLQLYNVDLESTESFASQPFPSLTEAEVSQTRLSGKDLERIGRINSLRSLVLMSVEFETTAPFAGPGFAWLKTLNLRGSDVTDEALTHLGQLPKLSKLHVGDTRITDRGIQRFSRENPGVQITH